MKINHYLLTIAVVVNSAFADVVIRPSDHVLHGTDYGVYSRRAADFEKPNILGPTGVFINHVNKMGDVKNDPSFAKDFWGVVDFPPVPLFHIDTHDPVSEDVFVSGSVHSKREPWDPYVWDRLVSILKGVDHRIPVMVDVGANLGYFSLAAASLGAHVIAFEPMSRNAMKFSKSIVKNNFQGKIMLFQNAVWADIKSIPVKLETGNVLNQGNGQILVSGVSAQGVYGLDYVNTVSLSYMVREDVDVLKIDTAGTEAVVIAGAKRLICNFRVKYIVMQFTDEMSGYHDVYSVLEMLTFLDSSGYEITDVLPDSPKLFISDYKRFPPNVLFTLKGHRPSCIQ
jgi:FkbM family methyltransferase